LEPSAPQDWGGGLIRLPAGGPIRLELVLEAVGQGIWLTGRAAFELVGQCARCLDPINRPAQAELQDLFLRSTRAPDGPDDDSALIQDDVIDLEPLVRDAIVIDLPLAPLCYDDCAGLCASCGANLNREPAHRHGPAADRRWAALADWVPSQSETTG
jgi:uncharacterized protein